MIHIRIDYTSEHDNSGRRFACGIGPLLPDGDKYYFEGEQGAYKADCQGCNPGGPHQLGTPINQLSGVPGTPGFAQFSEIARTWGHD